MNFWGLKKNKVEVQSGVGKEAVHKMEMHGCYGGATDGAHLTAQREDSHVLCNNHKLKWISGSSFRCLSL